MSTESFATDWDVEKYYDETEPQHQWELRKQFMLAHIERFPEDYLVALARAFTNMEFMGCSYHPEVMQRIAKLSEDVAKQYREIKKTKLQRTFVSASNAAESKAKRFSDPGPMKQQRKRY